MEDRRKPYSIRRVEDSEGTRYVVEKPNIIQDTTIQELTTQIAALQADITYLITQRDEEVKQRQNLVDELQKYLVEMQEMVE